MNPKRLTLIDGSGFIFRAFYALPNLTNPHGTPVGAVYGFVNMMQKLLRDAQNNEFDDYIAVIFDAGRLTFRNEIYTDYKANRTEPPEELRPQFALVREATAALNLPAIELPGFEADDLIASYTRAAKAQGFDEVIIVSSDKDLMQLVDEPAGIRLFDAMKSKVIGAAEVQEKFGVPPHKVRDVLALMGDSSDNVPGIPGIGPKTAAQLIEHFGDVESLLARAEEEITQVKRRQTILENADKARLSYVLVGLKDDCDLPVPLADCIEKPLEDTKLRAFLRDMGFKKLEEKLDVEGTVQLPVVSGQQPAVIPTNAEIQSEYTLLDDAALNTLLAQAQYHGVLAISVVESGIALSVEAGKAGYYPFLLRHPVNGKAIAQDLFAAADSVQSQSDSQNDLPPALQAALTNPTILKIGHAVKEDIKRLGIEISPQDDVCLLSYALGSGLHSHEFADIVQRELSASLTPEDSVLGKGKSKIGWAKAEASAIAPLLAERADYSLRLWHILKAQLKSQRLQTVYETLERPLLPVLAAMEQQGVLVDIDYLNALSQEFREQIAALEKEIYALAHQEFLIGSPKQLGEVLFENLGLPGGKKSKKSGQYGTGADVLEELAAQGHGIAEKVLSWRMYEKLRSTYTDALVKEIAADGRVHTILQQNVAATGRLSSTAPNLQNIPIRTQEGKRIRKAFIAAPGMKLISADYSQIELRLLAEMADIPVLKQAFKDGQDIHAATASQMFGIPLEKMTSEYRRRAKTINFGIIYGISAHGLAVRLGIDRGEAARFIEAYFELYPGIRRYMDDKKREANENGYITTLFGRRVHIKGIHDKNYALRAFAERQAINAPLQGTAADIIKRAMIAVSRTPYGHRMLLQVHDELVFEVPAAQAQTAAADIKNIMQNAAFLSVPLVVETGIGDDWGEIH